MTTTPLTLNTTGALRTFLAEQMVGVQTGAVDVAKASQIVKLAGQINESFYAEIKASQVRGKAGASAEEFGKLKIG